jgi:hypothetical protein
MRPRISIGRLLAIVGFCGVGFGALHEPEAWWASLLFPLAMVALVGAALGAATARSAGCLGFALVGSAYSTLAFAPWFSTEVRPLLPTTWAIDRLTLTRFDGRILQCPDDNTVLPTPGNLSYVVNTGFQRWNYHYGEPRKGLFALQAMTAEQQVGHSWFALALTIAGGPC